MAETEQTKRQMPKGGRKGGTQYPHLPLDKALAYSKKLVSKTHVSPLPAGNILPGVFGAAGGEGNVRASALKQYGLMEGPSTAYQASKLAKDIEAAPEEDKRSLLKQCALQPKVFKQLFDTFHGDSVSRARIEQRVKALNVHPDSAAECTTFFVASMATSGLGTIQGDDLLLSQAQTVASQEDDSDEDKPEAAKDPIHDGGQRDGKGEQSPKEEVLKEEPKSKIKAAAINVTIDVDSSSDPDKLERQLKLLQRFGLL